MKTLLSHLLNKQTLSVSEAESVMDNIIEGKTTEAEMASFLSFLRYRGETAEELTGFVQSLRKHALSIQGCSDAMDTCGTGGDNASTFNISTASAILLSSAGVKVAKHGNKAVSSKSGSRDVLDELGIPTETNPDQARMALKKHKMCFLFAPIYHQSMQHTMKVRKALGFRTVFNFLGPLVNPVGCKRQVIGVSDKGMAEKMGETLINLGIEKALLVTGKDGLDEFSVHGENTVIDIEHQSVRTYVLQPEEMGFRRGRLSSIQVNTAKESARRIIDIFTLKADEDSVNTILFNAGAGFYVSGFSKSISEGVKLADDLLKSGTALKQLKALQSEAEVFSHA